MSFLPSIFPGKVTVEETRFKSGVSEYLAQRLGQLFNFFADKIYLSKNWNINGKYGSVSIPHLAVDGAQVFEFDSEIFDVWVYNHTAGSGTTELDLKIATASGGPFTSIFSVTPKFYSGVSNDVKFNIGSSIAFTTAPVLTSGSNPLQVTAGTAIRCDKLQAQTNAENVSIIVHYRVR